jgi:hypothetical protein
MNPDSHALVSVMATAPGYQKNALIHFLYSYIAFQSYIGVLSKVSVTHHLITSVKINHSIISLKASLHMSSRSIYLSTNGN